MTICKSLSSWKDFNFLCFSNPIPLSASPGAMTRSTMQMNASSDPSAIFQQLQLVDKLNMTFHWDNKCISEMQKAASRASMLVLFFTETVLNFGL